MLAGKGRIHEQQCGTHAMSDVKIRNMDEFALVCWISRPTISKYFNDPHSVRDTTRQKIETALEKYDYRPNVFAMNQNRKLTKNVGIVVPYLADPFFAEIARNMEQRCLDHGFQPTLYSAHGQQNLEVDILDGLRSLKPAGVLLAPLGRDSDIGVVEKFCRDVPTVLFDSMVHGLDEAYVGSDNPQFARTIVEYLCQDGEPPCFFEMESPANPNAVKRRNAYLEAMEHFGHQPQIVQATGEGWSFEEVGRQGGLAALEADVFSTNTVLCSNDRLAIGFMSACFEKGITIGRGSGAAIRVAGQDDHPFSKFTCPPLTTIAQDYKSISHHALDTLFRVIDGAKKPRKDKLFGGHLIERASA